jgi:hypothetical protein
MPGPGLATPLQPRRGPRMTRDGRRGRHGGAVRRVARPGLVVGGFLICCPPRARRPTVPRRVSLRRGGSHFLAV